MPEFCAENVTVAKEQNESPGWENSGRRCFLPKPGHSERLQNTVFAQLLMQTIKKDKQMLDHKIQEDILRYLYNLRFEGNPGARANIAELVQNIGVPRQETWINLQVLCENGQVIEPGTPHLSAQGILFVEKKALLPRETIQKEQRIRMRILLALADLRKAKGIDEVMPMKELCERAVIEGPDCDRNVYFLTQLDFVDWPTNVGVRITKKGVEFLETSRTMIHF